MEQILLAHGLPKETVTTILILCKNMKAMVQSPNSDTDSFKNVNGILQEDTYMFIVFLDYILWMSPDLMKENGLRLKKTRSR